MFVSYSMLGYIRSLTFSIWKSYNIQMKYYMSVINTTFYLYTMVYMSALTYIPLYINKMLC